jgi:hypothetical protein
MSSFNIVTGCQHDPQRFPPFDAVSRLLNSSPSSDYRNTPKGFPYSQDAWFDGGDQLSTLDTMKSCRGTEEFNVGVDQQNMAYRWLDQVGGSMYGEGGGFSAEITIAMDKNWAGTGFPQDTVSSLPQSARSTSVMIPETVDHCWEKGVVYLDDRHVTDSAGSEYGTPDGFDGLHDESDRRNLQSDRANFEALWTGPMHCFLEGCRSKYVFPTPHSFYSHIKNVHEKAVFCSEPDCTFGKPFANNTDLKRHCDTKHKCKKPFKCEKQNCLRKVKAWARKDKFNLHNKKYHSNCRCFFCSETPRHQRWFDTTSELFAHTISDHAND